MKQVEIQSAELDWLRERLTSILLDIEKHDLLANSNLNNYKVLTSTISQSLIKSQDEYVSSNLLRKLFYYTQESPSVVFRVGFIDACYRYISQGEFNRDEYSKQLQEDPSLDPTHSHPVFSQEFIESEKPISEKILFTSYRFLGYGFSFTGVVIMVLVLFSIIDFRTIPWLLSKPPHHTRWVAEYHDGTKVYNRFRKYRTYEEARVYFDSKFRENKIKGDCNSYRLDSLYTHIAVCYTKEEMEEFESLHGRPVFIYKDPESENLHTEVEGND